MSRNGGFHNADIDAGFLDDPKVRRLVRSTRDEAAIARALVAYLATVLASWSAGKRLDIEEAAPLWLTGVAALAELLRAAELLDADGKVPEHVWDAWFTPAWNRREALRAGGSEGGRRSWKARASLEPTSPKSEGRLKSC